MIELRVAHLEGDVAELKSDIKSLVKDVAYLRGRIEHLPTT
jgi:hypothetical protein